MDMARAGTAWWDCPADGESDFKLQFLSEELLKSVGSAPCTMNPLGSFAVPELGVT